MNRFDRDFNDTDPITRRPFSDGHPDGVWIIVILLGIPLFAARNPYLGHHGVFQQVLGWLIDLSYCRCRYCRS